MTEYEPNATYQKDGKTERLFTSDAGTTIEKAIDAINVWFYAYNFPIDKAWIDVRENGEIKATINIQVKPAEKYRWVPVTERLPEPADTTDTYIVSDGKYVWLADYSNIINPVARDPKLIFDNGYAFGEWWDDDLDNLDKVTAWRELPEPYQEEKDIDF